MSDPATEPAEFVDPSAPVEAAPAVDLHEQAYAFEPLWQGKPLEAFTLSRQALAAELGSHRMALGGEAASEAYMPHVWAVLWLCLHVPTDWAALRPRPAQFWEVIEAWAEEHCPRPLWPEAVTLVFGDKKAGKLGLWEAARLNMVTVKKKPGPDLSGNGPRQ